MYAVPDQAGKLVVVTDAMGPPTAPGGQTRRSHDMSVILVSRIGQGGLSDGLREVDRR